MLYGYARVSSVDQDLAIQTQALTAAGCDIVRSEKVSGTSTKGREELKLLLDLPEERGLPRRHANRQACAFSL
jgi:DNA invertase Pin-like site-specific DNA recombinase